MACGAGRAYAGAMLDHTASRFATLTLRAMFVAGAVGLVTASCEKEEDDGEDTASSADDGQQCPTTGNDSSSADCQPYIDCVANMCDDCTDVCADFISCSAACDCNDTTCSTECFMNASPDCTSCFTTQATCVASSCSAELMMCGQ